MSLALIPHTYWTTKGFSELYSLEMVNLQRQLRMWTATLKRHRAVGELFVELSPEVHHSLLEEDVLLHDDALMPLWNDFASALSETREYFLLIVQDIQLSRSVLALLSPVLRQAPIAGLLLRNNKFARASGTRSIAKILEQCTDLTCLAACNRIESKGDCIALVNAIRQHDSIESLILHQAGLANNTLMKSIMPALQNHPTLEAVSLGNNDISSFGARLIADFLKTNPTLRTLHLDKNSLVDDDVILLAESLETNTNLVEINLHSNKFGACGASALLHTVYNTSSLDALSASNHVCHIKICAHLAALVMTDVRVGTDLAFNAMGLSAKACREAKLVCALSSDEMFQLLDDIPLRLMPHALEIFTSKMDDSCELSNRECTPRLDIVVRVMSGWKMPLLYRGTTCCDGWKKIQRKRARVGNDDDTNCYSIPLRRSTRSRMATTK